MLASAVIAVVQLQAAVDADRAASGQIDPECFAERQRLVDEVNALELPPAALDVLIDELGGKKAVAEMTGRKSRMVRSADGRRFVLEARAKPESSEMENLNVSERNAFMDGKKLIAIISDAASTGISLQADKRVANQRRRCHVTLELPWSADKAVQQLGRSHRANQVSAPLYVLLNTDVGGESRFASAVARRLQALGALTKGDRRAEAGLGALDSFNFDNACASLELLGATSPAERDKMEVRRFLNRLLGLPLREQNELFDLFCATLSGVISAARKDGKYDEGIADLSGASVSLEEPETALWSDPLTGAVMSTALVMVDRGVSWHAACEKLAARLALDGQQQPTTTTTTTSSAVAGAVVGGQRTPSSSARVPRSLLDLRRKYEKISPEEARLGWTASYEGALHDKSGGRLSRLQVLTGSTLPLLPLLEGLVKKHAGSLTKRDQSVAAMRVQLGERRLVGVRFPRSLMGDLKAELVAFQQQRQAGAGQHLTVDVARPFDAHAYAQATRPPQTLKNFFGGAASKPAMAPKMAPTTASNLFAASSSTAGLTPTTAPNPTSSIDLTAEISTQSDAAYAQRLQRQYDEESVSAPAPGGKSGLGKDIGNPVLGKDKGKVAVRAAPSGSTGDGGTGVKRKSVLELLGAKQVPRTH
ncbi:hypothetical protein Ctob_004022 [Chrysochromulina tobinii]|uniref:Strawberry notch helicase C domain-containing protein n=1 Tax=Chrysochromulina tobinii TaxID=1460289 RepID=A0A0M0JIM0_9EUKA|nr:hypothetical protein Ctob_004022 [Chrysochromulina tobinii]|eukprot:KOO26177.1 hypothetical protein Ctob_004022 [Chrysochromulina sp. CCMP291]